MVIFVQPVPCPQPAWSQSLQPSWAQPSAAPWATPTLAPWAQQPLLSPLWPLLAVPPLSPTPPPFPPPRHLLATAPAPPAAPPTGLPVDHLVDQAAAADVPEDAPEEYAPAPRSKRQKNQRTHPSHRRCNWCLTQAYWRKGICHNTNCPGPRRGSSHKKKYGGGNEERGAPDSTADGSGAAFTSAADAYGSGGAYTSAADYGSG